MSRSAGVRRDHGAAHARRIGTDILSVDRMRRCIDSPSFIRRTFTDTEIDLGASRADLGSYYAKVFAGKEAVFKCFGVQADSLRSWRDVEIVDRGEVQPVVRLRGALAAVAESARSPDRCFFPCRTTRTTRRRSRPWSERRHMATEPRALVPRTTSWRLQAQARSAPQRVVFPESTEENILRAARRLAGRGAGASRPAGHSRGAGPPGRGARPGPGGHGDRRPGDEARARAADRRVRPPVPRHVGQGCGEKTAFPPQPGRLPGGRRQGRRARGRASSIPPRT